MDGRITPLKSSALELGSLCSRRTVPSPGGQISGMGASSENCCGWAGWAPTEAIPDHSRPQVKTLTKAALEVPKLTIKHRRRWGVSLRDGSRTGPGYWWVTRGAGIPSRRRRRRSGLGGSVQLVQRMRCSTWTPHPDDLL